MLSPRKVRPNRRRQFRGHRAGMTTLQRIPSVHIPPLRQLTTLCEDLGAACGVFPRPVTVGVALNTSALDEAAARTACAETAEATGLVCTDPVRFGAEALLEAVLSTDAN